MSEPTKASGRTSRRPVFIGAALGLAMLLSLGIAEGVLRFTGTAPTLKLAGDFPELAIDHHRLYRMQSGNTSDLNSWGYRTPAFERKKAPGTIRITVLGDSLMLGLNVAAEQNIPARLAAHLGAGHEVLGLGVYGYGPDQSLIQLRRETRFLAPDAVVLGIFPGNDFADVVKNRIVEPELSGAPVLYDRNLLDRTVSPWRLGVWGRFWQMRYGGERGYFDAFVQALLTDSLDHTIMQAPRSPEAREQIAVMEAVLIGFRDQCETLGVPLLVVVIPSMENTGRSPPFPALHGLPPERVFANEQQVVEICKRLGISCIDATEAILTHPDGGPAMWDLDDGHLSPAGNDLVASLIADALPSRLPGYR